MGKENRKAIRVRTDVEVEYRIKNSKTSPKRIVNFLGEIFEIFGNRYVVLSREITKFHEEFIRGNVEQVLSVLLKRNEIIGEFTLLISGKNFFN